MERLVDHGDSDAIADEDGDGLTAGSQRAEVRSPFGLCKWPEALTAPTVRRPTRLDGPHG